MVPQKEVEVEEMHWRRGPSLLPGVAGVAAETLQREEMSQLSGFPPLSLFGHKPQMEVVVAAAAASAPKHFQM